MPSPAVQNPAAPAESKSAKKKKAKEAKAEHTESPASSASPAPDRPASVTGADASEDGSKYIQDLQKNIRNVTKKINGTTKTDIIIDQHKDKTLDELVDAKLINADQRAQRLKKPQLEAQLAQYEEQLAQYKKVDEDYRSRSAADKAALEKALTEKFEKEKADIISELTEKAAADAKQSQHTCLLILSQFLRLAAARRSEEADASLDENMALEGVLLNVYSGDEHAVATMFKLIEGSPEKTFNVANEELQTTYGQVKAAATAYIGPYDATEAAPDTSETVAEPIPAAETDLNIAHAESDAPGATEPLTNGHTESTPPSGVTADADVSDNAANAATGSEWDANNNTMSSSITQEGWVEVPRDPSEPETGSAATPAAPANVQSWADDQPENPPEQASASADANDGFRQVHRTRPRGHDRENSGRGRGRGDHRGGHRGGYHEGRGGRGRGRGRGSMSMRGRPRPEEP
ncbi:hypothetical protein SAMD00023353_3400120 [Rosellinia necatrix]|uniref:YAG7-like dimerisation domain-containing protein n=1 Tax=Rosellinia necatrix TaxID=77044 RepID=A0A1W2TKX5_ROSNE|nr:hypothetical protein SAMD00023353_3400120 [Rosellinia necatrix]